MAATARPVPRWANWAAHAVPLAVLPSGLWRIALGFGVPVGFSGELARLYEAPGWFITPYVVVLSLVTEGFALLALGLVRPWGEVFPRWMPVVGGRNVPVPFAVGAALAGAVAVALISVQVGTQMVPTMTGDPEAPQGIAGVILLACYAPAIAWGPLLVVLTAHYALRRRQVPVARAA